MLDLWIPVLDLIIKNYVHWVLIELSLLPFGNRLLDCVYIPCDVDSIVDVLANIDLIAGKSYIFAIHKRPHQEPSCSLEYAWLVLYIWHWCAVTAMQNQIHMIIDIPVTSGSRLVWSHAMSHLSFIWETMKQNRPHLITLQARNILYLGWTIKLLLSIWY